MTSASIPFVNLSAQWKDEREELLPIIEMVMSTGQYIGGEVIERFESKVANLCKTRFCGLSSTENCHIIWYSFISIGFNYK